ncbi:Smu-2 suppressor of mec-8 and unc-52 protein [Asimina triloba]
MPAPAIEEKQEAQEGPRYRDRAKERREDQNPDYEPTELGSFHAVAPPGTADLRMADAHKISIENSKYLGGEKARVPLLDARDENWKKEGIDEGNVGLDYALLHKVRSEIDKKPEAEDVADGKSRVPQDDQPVSFRTAMAKSVHQWIVKPQSMVKPNEMFLPGRMAFIFNMEEGYFHDIPTTLHRSKADCPIPEEIVSVSVDGSVLDRIAKIMSYLRLGSSGKVLKKKKKDRDVKDQTDLGLPDLNWIEKIGAMHKKMTSVVDIPGINKRFSETFASRLSLYSTTLSHNFIPFEHLRFTTKFSDFQDQPMDAGMGRGMRVAAGHECGRITRVE